MGGTRPTLAAIRGILALAICVAGAGGCSREQGQAPAPAAPPPGPVLRIGLLPEQDIFRQIERYEPLAAYLSRATGTQIRLQVLPSYSDIIEGFESARLDGAFVGSFSYVVAHERLGVSVVARPVSTDGASTYHGLIFTRRDDGIRTIDDMRGKRFVFVDPATTAGYLLPLHYFHEHGVMDYTKFLAESYYAGTHEDAILDVLDSKADIGAAKNTVFERLAARDPRIDSELVVLATSPDVPEAALALRAGLDPALRGALRAALLGMHEDPEGRKTLEGMQIRRFIETTDEDYAPVYRYAREIGLELDAEPGRER